MKKILLFPLLCATLTAMTVASCTKELYDDSRTDKAGEVREVQFDLDAALTKTAISDKDGVLSINWEKTDNSFIHIYENGKEGTKAKITVSKNGKATLSVNFSGLGLALINGFTYNGIIAGNFTDGIISVPEVQNPIANSFDPAADVLIAKSYYEGKARPILTGLKLDFQRANAISRLELTGMAPGEKIEYIEISAANQIAGPFNKLENTEFSGYSENGSNNIKLYFPDNSVIGADGSFITYFSSWTTEQEALTVSVMTENRTYIQSVEPVTLNTVDIKTIKACMEGKDIQTKRYELVTGAPEDWSGTYIFLSSAGAGDAKVLNATASAQGFCDDVQVKEFGGLVFVNASDDIDALSWDISDSGSKSSDETLWNVMTGSAGFLGFGSTAKYLYDKDGITVAKTNYSGSGSRKVYYRHIFGFDNGTSMASFNGTDKTYLEYTGAGFAYTTNEGARVYLYKYTDAGRKSQVVAFNEETVYWPLTEGKYEIGGTYPVQAFTKKSDYQKELLSYSSSDPSVASIDAAGNITIHKQGDVTIEALAANSPEYRAAAASYDIVISVPYYQRIKSADEIVGGDKYLIVSRNNILGSNWYHAFNAVAENGYNYDITTLENLIIGNPVYDNGERIKPSEAIDANQVIIENGLFSSIAKLMNLNGTYTIKPVATGNYMYCDMNVTEVLDTQIQLPTYSIAFDDVNMSGSILSWFGKVATIPHSIVFDEDGTVSVRSALSSMSAIGADLFYSPLTKQYAYINMSIFDNISTIADFMQYYSADTQYEWIVNLIKFLGDNISVRELIEYFAADMYIYRYIE